MIDDLPLAHLTPLKYVLQRIFYECRPRGFEISHLRRASISFNLMVESLETILRYVCSFRVRVQFDQTREISEWVRMISELSRESSWVTGEGNT